MKSILQGSLITVLVTFGIMPFVLHACDREQQYQQAKISQWQKDIKQGKNFTEYP